MTVLKDVSCDKSAFNNGYGLAGECGSEGEVYNCFANAIDHCCDESWSFVHKKYNRLICHWICREAPALCHDEVGALSQEVLVRSWRCSKAKETTFREQFPHLPAVMAYLKMCARTVVIDRKRRMVSAENLTNQLTIQKEQTLSKREFENQQINRLTLQQEVASIFRWVDQHLTDPKDRIVIQASFVDGMKPREIAHAYAHQFGCVKDVRRSKERTIKRLRRYFAPSQS